MRFFLVLALLASMFACGKPQVSLLSVVGGELEEDADIVTRSTLAIVYDEKGAFCTGVLIGPKHIVTAAHCLQSMERSSLRLGAQASAKIIDDLRIDDFFAHPDNNGGTRQDVGVIVLSGDIPSFLAPVQLANSSATYEGEPVELVGYGETVREAGDSGVLRKVATTIEKYDAGRKEFSIKEGTKKGVCTGDSGGPAYMRQGNELLLAGIVSRGTELFCDSGNGIYMDVRRYQGWMKCVFEELGSPLESFARWRFFRLLGPQM